jgi:hypothetical protein
MSHFTPTIKQISIFGIASIVRMLNDHRRKTLPACKEQRMVWFLFPLLFFVFHSAESASYTPPIMIRTKEESHLCSRFQRKTTSSTTTATATSPIQPPPSQKQRYIFQTVFLPSKRLKQNHITVESSVARLHAMVDRRTIMMMTTSLVTGLFFPIPPTQSAPMANDNDIEDKNNIDRIISGLKVPSEDQPQIPFPDNQTIQPTTATIEGS